MSQLPCLPGAVSRFLGNLGVPPLERLRIARSLECSISVFQANQPAPISDITNQLYACLQPNVGSAALNTAEELKLVLIFLVVLTAIFMVLVVIILAIFDKSDNVWVVIGIIILFALFYILIAWIIIFNASTKIANSINNFDNQVRECVNIAITQLDIFEIQQENAINLGLCIYGTLPCPSQEIELENTEEILLLENMIEEVLLLENI